MKKWNGLDLLAVSLAVSIMTAAGVVQSKELEIVVKTAPIVPHGLITGEPMDITLSFADLDPKVPGIEMREGGTATIYLPPEVSNLGYPVSKPGEAEGCEPPVLARCSSGGFLHGWPQSPLLPLNTIAYNEDDHSITLTSTKNSPPYDLDNPGAKLIHLFTFGFQNPTEPGDYPMKLELQPDPDKPVVFSGNTMLKVSAERKSNLATDSTQAPHIKGPKFKNTMFQTLKPGETTYPISTNMWNANHEPIIGARVDMISNSTGNIVAVDGTTIGSLVIDAPAEAKGYFLMSAPSFPTKTGLAGYPTGRLVMTLKTDRAVKGDYKITLALTDSNPIVHHISTK